jgi:hypothetical protein
LVEAWIRFHEGIKGTEKDHNSPLHIENPRSISLVAVNAKGAPVGFPLRKNGIHVANTEKPLPGGPPLSGEKVVPEIRLGEPLNLEAQFTEPRIDNIG